MQTADQAQYAPFDARTWKIGIVVAQFNQHITANLLQSALARAEEYGIVPENITVVEVAGAVETPLVLQELASVEDYRVLLAVGCIVQGDTPHFDYVCKFVTDGILRIQLDYKQPIGFGVLTCKNQEQAEERISLGRDHLDAVMQQAKVIEDLYKS